MEGGGGRAPQKILENRWGGVPITTYLKNGSTQPIEAHCNRAEGAETEEEKMETTKQNRNAAILQNLHAI